METKNSKGIGLMELKGLAIARGQGIYFLYMDHLRTDAVTAIIVNDKVEEVEFIPSFSNCIKTQIEEFLKVHSDLSVYWFDVSYYSFPCVWRKSEIVLKYLPNKPFAKVEVDMLENK